MEVIVTGGAGYIGSTICSSLVDDNHLPIILDSLVTGNRDFANRHAFFEGDICDRDVLRTIRERFPKANTVIHCAARIVVDESIADPYLYYNENVLKSLEFFKNCSDFGFRNIVFSSSASVYGESSEIAVDEESPCFPNSPYASTKLMMETILSDFCTAFGLNAVSLRYFNPIGADPKLRTGQFKKNQTHLLGKLISSALNDETFIINGNDWPTRDGTPIRDFIHVWDLAVAHVRAIEFLHSPRFPTGKHLKINIATGAGTTVQEFVNCYKNIQGNRPKVVFGPRREGDIAGAYAVTSLAQKLLNWKADLSIQQGIQDELKWQNHFTKLI